MRQYFRKGDVIRSFEVRDGKVLTTIVVGTNQVINPTLEQFYADGWEDYIMPVPEPVLPTIEELVERALRYGEDGGTPTYTINQEFEVNRRRDTHPQEFATYNARVEECIAWANEQPHREEE